MAHCAAAASAFLLDLSQGLHAWDAGEAEPAVRTPRGRKRGGGSAAHDHHPPPAKRAKTAYQHYVQVKGAQLKGQGWKPSKPGDTFMGKVARAWNRLSAEDKAAYLPAAGEAAAGGGGGEAETKEKDKKEKEKKKKKKDKAGPAAAAAAAGPHASVAPVEVRGNSKAVDAGGRRIVDTSSGCGRGVGGRESKRERAARGRACTRGQTALPW
jgi:hypothetical protein